MKGKILALDISSRCTGWVIFTGGKLTDYGTIKIDPKNGWGFRLSIFGSEIKRLLEENEPDRVVIEDIYRGPSALTFKVLALFHGVAYREVSDAIYAEPDIIGVMSARKIVGDYLGIVCRSKEQSFFIMNEGLKLGLDFKTGNDISDACISENK
jgi:Holliday junction resolvasome RuvABC endonuclease subunit